VQKGCEAFDMKITLPIELKHLVEASVREGSYSSESEVVADALRRLIGGGRPPCVDTVIRVAVSGDVQLFSLGLGLANLMGQLAEVEIQIRRILQEIELRKHREEGAQDRIQHSVDALDALLKNLSATAEAYDELLKSTSLNL